MNHSNNWAILYRLNTRNSVFLSKKTDGDAQKQRFMSAKENPFIELIPQPSPTGKSWDNQEKSNGS
jgi:hypothetical protein